MIKKYLMLTCLASFMILGQVVAQVSDPGCDPLDPACPIDGGISLLVAAGIGLAAGKARQRAKSRRQEPGTGQ